MSTSNDISGLMKRGGEDDKNSDMLVKVLFIVLVFAIMYCVYVMSCALMKKEGLLSNYDTRVRHAAIKDEVGRRQYAETSGAGKVMMSEGMAGQMADRGSDVARDVDEMLIKYGSNPAGQYNVSNIALTGQLYSGN